MRSSLYEIGVVGAGNAAEGIVHGILRSTLLFNDRIIASDPVEARRLLFKSRFDVAVTDDNRGLVSNSYIIILAVKPQQFVEVVQGFADLVTEDHLIVSIMAGVSTATLEGMFPDKRIRVVRAMPNLPVHVGAGMAGVCRGSFATEADLLRAQRIFDAGGRSIVIEDESRMDAVTAVSGSGPAYFYYFVEALTEAGERAGLTRQQADILAKQTCLGAARMMLESGEAPAVLRQKVTSPGGTTQAAIESMTKNKVFQHICEGVDAACRRSRELGR
jgi:pyrroline-5-carboxylate reductase